MDRRRVARVLGPRADGRRRVERLPTAVLTGVVVHAVVLGVLPRHQLGPRRAAQRVRRLRLGERHPLVDQKIPHVREVGQVVLAHVVGQEDQHVGRIGVHDAAACATSPSGAVAGATPIAVEPINARKRSPVAAVRVRRIDCGTL